MQPSVRVLRTAWTVVVGLLWACRSQLPHSTHLVQAGSMPPSAAEPSGALASVGAGWQLVAERFAADRYVSLADGSRLFLIRGMRFVERPDGSVARGEEVFDSASVRFSPRPERLGGGFWFFRVEGAETEIWRTRHFTGALQPIARLSFAAERLIAGFNGVWAQSASRDRMQWVADDSDQPEVLGQLPAAPALSSLAVGRAGRAVAVASVVGPLWTDDFGAHWKPLPVPHRLLGLQVSPQGEPQVRTATGLWELDSEGALVETTPSGPDGLFESLWQRESTRSVRGQEVSPSAVTEQQPAPLGRGGLRSALLRGVADSPTTALVIEGERLVQVDLRSGRVLRQAPYLGVRTCRGLPFGTGAAFSCGVGGGPGEVYRAEGLQLHRLGRWQVAPSVREGSGGTLLVGAHCPVSSDGSRTQTQRVRADSAPAIEDREVSVCVLHPKRPALQLDGLAAEGQQRIVSLLGGGVAVLDPPSRADSGLLTLYEGGHSVRRKLQLPEVEEGAPAAQDARWPVDWVQGVDGQLRGWLGWGESFAAVAISTDGMVRVGPLQQSTSESLFYKGRVLQVLSSSTLRQTGDYGETWASAILPPALLSTVSPPGMPVVRGCSSVGCVYGDFGRVGYGPFAEPTRAPAPPLQRHSLGYSFWSLSCQLGRGKLGRSTPSLAGAQPSRVAPKNRRLEEPLHPPFSRSSWLPLMGRAGPLRSEQDASFDLGQVDRRGAFRGYAWGPGNERWSRHASWVLYVQDRFAAQGPWSTSPSSIPWASAASASAAFGLDYSVTADWQVHLAASGTEGLLRVQQSRTASIFLVEEDRAPVPLAAGTLAHRGQFAGAVKASGRWFVAEAVGDQLIVYRLVGKVLKVLGTYPMPTPLVTRLVGNATRDGLAIVQKTRRDGWYVFPLDWVTGRASAGVHIARELLSQFPRACSNADSGWRMVSSVPLTDPYASESNTHLEYAGNGGSLPVHALEANLLVDASGPCVDSLAALAKKPLAGRPSASSEVLRGETVPLVVTEPLSEQRWQLRCGR